MAWFVLARVLIVAAVAYSAALLQPLPVGLVANIVFAIVLSGLVVVFETRVREIAPSRVLGALLGCAIGLAIARAIESGLFFADSSDRKVEFLHSFLLIVAGIPLLHRRAFADAIWGLAHRYAAPA